MSWIGEVELERDAGLQQVQCLGFGYRLDAAFYGELAIDFTIMPFDRVQSDEKPLTNLTIRESLGNESQHL